MSDFAAVMKFIPIHTEARRTGLDGLKGESRGIVLRDAFVLSTAGEFMSVWRIDQWLRNSKKGGNV